MHDAIIAESLGKPAVAVMTEKFVSAAELMARVLGLPDYPFAIITHPLSSASDESLASSAALTVDTMEALLLRAGDGDS